MPVTTRPVTIRDVARQAQVSVSTVSRALTAPELVRAETRVRVLEVAHRLGYQPNPAARSLITGRTGNLGIVVPDLGNPFYPGVMRGAQASARESGRSVFFCDSGGSARQEAALVRSLAPQVDGLVLCSPLTSGSELAELVALRTTVLLNRPLPGVSAVLMDSRSGAEAAVARLALLGHRRCAYLAGPDEAWSNGERLAGLRVAAGEHGVELRALGPFPPSFTGGELGADEALSAGVTALVAYNDLMALGALERLRERGVVVPDRMAVVGFDDLLYSAVCHPSLTTVALPMEEGGRAAVRELLARLAGEPPSTRVLPTSLRVRASTG
ncbi:MULTISPECIES: LacI family DNA-binding transcriptional regulator [Actinosynnema]|uniref:LacI family DNA-binding transcriptional regulator n=1 Tax=Actinosynnema TaxID=40566 RepID=UPI0020A2BDAC|nr:LacI family DNA-binding transcriptional regulator [Actinosynnema pretiosum]MCP2098657.1 transcriptional regulator, LacI family [Actinosynnema pretiosum]